MNELWPRLLVNYPYLAAAILFVIGTFTVLTHPNLFKKLLGINIMESAIFLTFVASGNIRGGCGADPCDGERRGGVHQPAAFGFDVDRDCGQCECDRLCPGADCAVV